MAKTARGRLSWLWRASLIGRKGPRKANPKYTRNKNKNWSASDLRMLRRLARDNTPDASDPRTRIRFTSGRLPNALSKARGGTSINIWWGAMDI